MKKNKKTDLEELQDETVLANELTGALQRITTDEETILKYHKLFNEE